jgi:hypothetical protein
MVTSDRDEIGVEVRYELSYKPAQQYNLIVNYEMFLLYCCVNLSLFCLQI